MSSQDSLLSSAASPASESKARDYRVLARRWRPGNFSQMAGQEAVVQALVNGLNSGRVHHAFLFTGTRGVGKTTLARILAKCLNCEQQISATPCGECGACLDIDAGRFVDLIEVDAASRTKVDDTRELLDNVQYAATRGRYKVYLIDEVHMLSLSSFNALLKTLEEPPEHVKFILATTDPQKIPVTILSRCLRFNLRRMSAEQIDTYLSMRLEAEQIAFEPEALMAIARAADGSMRDALSLLDQALAHGSGQLLNQLVQTMLGMVESRFIEQLLTALLTYDANVLLSTAAEIYAQGQSADRTLQQLAEALHRITVLQLVPDYADHIDSQQADWHHFADKMSKEDIQLYYQIATLGRSELAHAPDPRIGLDMTLLRMLAFCPADSEALPPANKVLANNTVSGSVPAPKTNYSAEAAKPTESKRDERPVAKSAAALDSRAEIQQTIERPQGRRVPEPSRVSARMPDEATPVASSTPAPAMQVQESSITMTYSEPINRSGSNIVLIEDLLDAKNWASLCLQLSLSGPLRVLAHHLLPSENDVDQLLCKMEERDAHVHTQRLHQQLTELLSEYFGQTLKLKVQYTDDVLDTPSRLQAAAEDHAQQRAHQVVADDKVINDMIETFDARIVPGSVKPDSNNTA